MSNVVHLPRPQTHDPNAIFKGRMRALTQYQDARTDQERVRALVWVNHWRLLDQHAKALRGKPLWVGIDLSGGDAA